MSNQSIEISPDANGIQTLFIRGAWSEDVARALQRSDWEALAVFGVTWSDYQALGQFAGKIRRIRVPFGPDSSKGLEMLVNLESLESADTLKPAVDFSKFKHLKFLEAIWDKKHPEYFANHSLKSMTLHVASGDSLEWLTSDMKLEKLSIRGGRLKSVNGLRNLQHLEELHLQDLKYCTDVNELRHLKRLKILEVDAPKAVLDDIDWMLNLSFLETAALSSYINNINWRVLGDLPSIRSIGFTTAIENDAGDEEIIRLIELGGRRVSSIKRFRSKFLGIQIDIASG